jgi:dihydrodiol dehydrogenase / D-xylose 1-dehydrogenase (NADP)
MSSEFVLKWGIASAGHISGDFCASLLSLNSTHHQLIAVAARSVSDAQKFAERFHMPLHFDSYQRLAESNDINIVYVGSINIAHKEICLMAINAGKHVLCEKPMSMNAREQEEVLQAAKAKGVFFMEVFKKTLFKHTDIQCLLKRCLKRP